MSRNKSIPLKSYIIAFLPLIGQAESTPSLPTLEIDAQQTANLRPVSTYPSPVSNLEFDPRIDLQSRSMAEAQSDVTLRGGIFENTGFRIGSATLIDPQTGHYSAELPVASEMLTHPEILTGTANALYGFNSTVGTISYGWSQINKGGSLTVGGGDHALNFQRIHRGLAGLLGKSGQWSWAVEAEISRSESDGTITLGDHAFERSSGRVQILGPCSQTDFFAGYQAKFFAWPGMYTANTGNLETENLKTRLFMVNHQQTYGDDSDFEITAYHRRHSDHYVLKRKDPDFFKAFHESKISSIAVAGKHKLSEAWAILYSAQLTADEIQSADFFKGTPLGGLERGEFQSRSYYKLSVLPEYGFKLNEQDHVTLRAGATFDDTNRNDDKISALIDFAWQRQHGQNHSDWIFLSFTETSQVAGYTAIGGGTAGLFASNPDLRRETSQNLELGTKLTRPGWSFESALFYRRDDDLTDWTFEDGSPNARTANPVDIKTLGFEMIGSKRWGDVEGIIGYTYLHKNEDYGAANIDASFYALNYPEHRVTLATIWRPREIFEVRIDNEWRQNKDNALRTSDDQAFFTHFGFSFYPPQVEGLELFVAIDNAWDDDFQDVPGTPGRGDQYSAGATLRW